jgi:hypothetical protein
MLKLSNALLNSMLSNEQYSKTQDELLLIKKVLSLASILTFWVPEERFHDIREFL